MNIYHQSFCCGILASSPCSQEGTIYLCHNKTSSLPRLNLISQMEFSISIIPMVLILSGLLLLMLKLLNAKSISCKVGENGSNLENCDSEKVTTDMYKDESHDLGTKNPFFEDARDVIDSFVNIHNRLLMAAFKDNPSSAILRTISSLNYVLATFTHAPEIRREQPSHHEYATAFSAPSVEDIFRFDQMACALEERNLSHKIVFQSRLDWHSHATLAFLMGCHMMLSHGLGFEETYLAFRRLHTIMDPEPRNEPQITVKSCLRAFCRAKCSNWMIFKGPMAASPDSNNSIHIEKYLQYARCAHFLLRQWCFSTPQTTMLLHH